VSVVRNPCGHVGVRLSGTSEAIQAALDYMYEQIDDCDSARLTVKPSWESDDDGSPKSEILYI
jgi:hypothetical protein